ncbi:MAG: hypothetical protein U1E53_25840 [Dongiaceae bacterium]
MAAAPSPTSYNDYEIVAANLLDGGRRRVSDRIAAYGLYIDPPLGRAGQSGRKCKLRTWALIHGFEMVEMAKQLDRQHRKGSP